MVGKEGLSHKESAADTNGSTADGYAQTQPKKGGKIKRHCGRFWWIYVLLFIIIFLVIFLPLIYVAIPNIAQDGVNDSTFEVTRFAAYEPTADSVHLTQEFVIKSNNKYHPHIEAFGAETGVKGEAPYATLALPATDSGDEVSGSFTQRLQITNSTAFAEYNRAVMVSEEVTLYVKGKTDLHQGGFPTAHVDYNKEVTVKGFNKLKGFELTSFHVSNNYARDGTNGNGTVTIPNPSDITVEMGNVTFNNYVGNVSIGNTTIYNLLLRPGPNYYPVVAYVDLLAVLGLIGPNATYEKKNLPITIVGNSSVYHGVHLEYYEYALKAVNQTTSLNTTKALSNE